MAPLRILTLLIDKTGHRHQAEGVARVMGRLRPAVSVPLEVRPRWFAPPPLRQLGVNRWRALPPGLFLRVLWGIDAAAIEPPDVIVGSGRPAIGVGLLLKRRFGVPYVYSGLGRGVPTIGEIDLRLVSHASQAGDANAELTPVPSLIEPDRLPPPRRLAGPADLAGATVGVLLGGEAHSHGFDAADWADLAALVAALKRRWGARVLVGTSRRTGAAGTAPFARLAAEGAIDGFVDARTAGPGSAAPFFEADALIVTEDSVSMMSEAVAARRPVVALRPRRFEPTLVDEVVASLVDTGALAVLPIAGTDAEGLAARLTGLTPIAWDFRDRIGAALVRRLPALFAGEGRA